MSRRRLDPDQPWEIVAALAIFLLSVALAIAVIVLL